MSYGPLPLSALTGENSKCKPYIIPQFHTTVLQK